MVGCGQRMATNAAVDAASAASYSNRGDLETHSFIIKIWAEERAEGSGRVLWRGHITHVPSGVRVYLRSLADVPAVIGRYVDRLGVRVGVATRLWSSLRRLFVIESQKR